MSMNYYLVGVKCGHVGVNYYYPAVLTICAQNGRDAALKARRTSRVKHNHKDAIRFCKKVDECDFVEQAIKNKNDPYFHCHNKQEQNRFKEQIDMIKLEDNHRKEFYSKTRKSRRPNLKYQSQKVSYYDNEYQDEDGEGLCA